MKMLIEYDDLEKTANCSINYVKTSSFDDIALVSSDKFEASVRAQLPYIPAVNIPPAIRYISPDHSVILWERPPGYVPFNLTEKMQEEILSADAPSRSSLRLPVPWQRYIMLLSQDNRIANLFMFFANEQIRSLEYDALCCAPIPNFYGNNRLCPASYSTIPNYDKTLTGAVEAAYDLVWGSGFNWDTVLGIKQYMAKKNQISSFLTYYQNDFKAMFLAWSKQSLTKVMSWDWPKTYESFSHFLSTKDLYYDYPGKGHDTLVKFVFAAQDAKSK